MKKLHLLSGMIVFSAVASINADVAYPGGITGEQARKIEAVQWKKIERQRELERPDVYKLIDVAIEEGVRRYGGEPGREMLIEDPIIVNWPVIFNILNSMRGIIDVNEYRTYNFDYPLLYVAVKQGNALAVKTLLEKYNANPNALAYEWPSAMADAGKPGEEMTPLMLARKQGDNAIVNLLIKHGAKK